jgi:hypothetical protein
MRRSRNSDDGLYESLPEERPLVVSQRIDKLFGNLSCSALLDMSPARYGYLDKMNESMWPRLFPCVFSEWKPRYFILAGGYLYRFESDALTEPVKGAPIPIDSATMTYIGDGVFEISTIRKVYKLRAQSEKDAVSWISDIKARKFEAVRENMGHAPLDAATKQANKIADNLYKTKIQRERRKQSMSSPYAESALPP